VAFYLLTGGETVEVIAQQYFSIRIWGAPATLSIFALMGVLIGLGQSRTLLLVQLFLNGLNMVLDIWFAGLLGWGAEGIALGTVIAEWSTVVFSGWLVFNLLNARKSSTEQFWSKRQVFDPIKLRRTLSANTDIMIRTLLLVFSFAWFTNQSARFGDVVLAANHILLQFVSFAAFFLDGYAFVVESLVGSAIGKKSRVLFDAAIKKSTVLALVTAWTLAMWIWLFGDVIMVQLTDFPAVRTAANEVLFLAAIYVMFSFVAFQLDGIFIGASYTRQMRNAAFISLMVYLLVWWVVIDRYGVNGLWWAMIIYVSARAGALLFYFPSLRKSIVP